MALKCEKKNISTTFLRKYIIISLNLLTPTHAQLNFIKNHLKNSYMFRSTTIFREL